MIAATPFVDDPTEFEIEPTTGGTDTPTDPPETGDGDGENGDGESDDEHNGDDETAINVTPAHDVGSCYQWLANGPTFQQWVADQKRRYALRMGV